MTKHQKIYLAVLRIAVGWYFFYAGLEKLTAPYWSAAGFLETAKSFTSFYNFLSQPGLVGLVNFLNEWGLLLIGLALILGLWTRLVSVLGIILMALYYFASNNFPFVTNGFLVDDHIILIVVLLVFITFRAGHFWGLDAKRQKAQ